MSKDRDSGKVCRNRIYFTAYHIDRPSMLIAWLNVLDNGEAVCKNEGFKSVRLRK